MKHPFVRLVLVELEACVSVMAFVVGLMIVTGLISTGTIHMPLEWLRSTFFALLLPMGAVADYLWRAEFRSHHAHTRHVSHA